MHHLSIDNILLVSILDVQKAAFPNRLHLQSAILKLVVVLFNRLLCCFSSFKGKRLSQFGKAAL